MATNASTASTIAVVTTKPSSNYNIQQTCKVDISKFPQYYFSLDDDAGGYSLVMYSCVMTVILIFALIIFQIFFGSLSLLVVGGLYAFLIELAVLFLLVPCWAGFIILFNSVKDYQKLSKTIRIYNNPKTAGCLITTPGDNTGSKKVYLDTKDSLNYIAFSSVLMILFYAIVCVTLLVAMFINIYKMF